MSNIIPGVMVDLEKLKKTQKIVLWGKLVRKDSSVTPHVKLFEVAVDWNAIFEKTIIADAYIHFE